MGFHEIITSRWERVRWLKAPQAIVWYIVEKVVMLLLTDLFSIIVQIE